MLSASGRYLWATARPSPSSSWTGYVACFLLADDGNMVRPMFRIPTTEAGGAAEAVSPAPWSDEYAAMAHHPGGYVEVLKMEGRRETGQGVEYASAKVVARVDIGDGGCCANAIWYS